MDPSQKIELNVNTEIQKTCHFCNDRMIGNQLSPELPYEFCGSFVKVIILVKKSDKRPGINSIYLSFRK